MKRKWFKFAGAAAIVTAAWLVQSCGHEQELVSINIQPSAETIGATNIPLTVDAGASVQLSALGSYIHPPVTKDITTQVTWDSNTPAIASVNANGLLVVAGQACGSGLITATVKTNHSSDGISSSGAIVTGNMTVTVVCPTM